MLMMVHKFSAHAWHAGFEKNCNRPTRNPQASSQSFWKLSTTTEIVAFLSVRLLQTVL